MYLGELVEFGETDKIFTAPAEQPHAGLHHRPLRLRRCRRSDGILKMVNHTVRAYDADLESLDRHISEMGGIAEKMLADAMDALASIEHGSGATASSPPIRASTCCSAKSRNTAFCTIARRQPMAVDLREIVGVIRISADLERIGDLAKNIAKRAAKIADEARLPRAIVGLEVDARPRRRATEGRARRLCPARSRTRPGGVGARRRTRRAGGFGVPRSPYLHDGRSAQHLLLHPFAVLFPRTSNGSAITPPISPKRSSTSSPATRCPSTGRAGAIHPTL